MGISLLDIFKNWMLNYLKSCNHISWELYETSKTIDKPALYFNLDTNTKLSRIEVWETGDSMLEILDFNTGEQLYSKYKRYSEYSDFNVELSEFFSFLKDR